MTDFTPDFVKMLENDAQEMASDANACIIEILESYMDFLGIVDKLPLNLRGIATAKAIAKPRKIDWQPILDTARAKQKGVKK